MFAAPTLGARVIRSHMTIDGRKEVPDDMQLCGGCGCTLRSGFIFLGTEESGYGWTGHPHLGAWPLQILEAQRIRMPNSRQSQITRAGQIEFNNKHEDQVQRLDLSHRHETSSFALVG